MASDSECDGLRPTASGGEPERLPQGHYDEAHPVLTRDGIISQVGREKSGKFSGRRFILAGDWPRRKEAPMVPSPTCAIVALDVSGNPTSAFQPCLAGVFNKRNPTRDVSLSGSCARKYR